MRYAHAALFVLGTATLLTARSAAEEKPWTRLKGRIVLAKEAQVPEPAPIDVSNHPDKSLCEKDGKLLSEEWVVNPKNRGVKNVVVWIEPAGAKRGAPFPPNRIHSSLAKPAEKEVVIDQPCCRFIPHALVARAGQDVVIKNSAPKPHNANWNSSNNGAFNTLLAPGSDHRVEALAVEKNPILISCNIHPWMKARVFVFDHPYYAITDPDGHFEIKNAPEGDFTLYTRHDTGEWNNGPDGQKGTRALQIKGATLDEGDIPFAPNSLLKK